MRAMRNIILFIQRHFVFLCFLALQAVALWMLFRYNRFHNVIFLGAASEITGRVNSQVDKVDDYFGLREENRRVHRMNDSLLNELRGRVPVTNGVRSVTDSLKIDSTVQVRRYVYRDAKVVFNSVTSENNYLQLSRGSNDGVTDNMAVIHSDGAVVGIVVATSANFSQVMSLLHTKSRVPAALKRTGTTGTVRWDAVDPRFLVLEGISRDVEVKKGDTVLTSNYSYNYPPNFLIGRVADIRTDKGTGFYNLRIRTAAPFNSIQQVFVVENLQRAEQQQLQVDTEKKIDQRKN